MRTEERKGMPAYFRQSTEEGAEPYFGGVVCKGKGKEGGRKDELRRFLPFFACPILFPSRVPDLPMSSCGFSPPGFLPYWMLNAIVNREKRKGRGEEGREGREARWKSKREGRDVIDEASGRFRLIFLVRGAPEELFFCWKGTYELAAPECAQRNLKISLADFPSPFTTRRLRVCGLFRFYLGTSRILVELMMCLLPRFPTILD